MKEIKMQSGYKESSIGIIPKDWEVRKLGELGELKNGINKDKEDFGFGFPMINLMDVFGINKVFSDNFKLGLVNANERDLKEFSLKKGDVLFVRSSVKPEGVGLTTLICDNLENTTYSGFLIRFRDNGLLDFDYKAHCFFEERFRKNLLNKSTISANTNINQDALNSLMICVPPLPEQTAIANLLSTWDKAIQTTTALIEQKQNRKKWLMQMLLSGKKRLKGFEKGKWKKFSYDKVLKVVKRHIEWDDEKQYRLISVRRRSGGIFEREPLYGKQILVKDLRIAKKGDFLFSKMQIVHGASALVTKEFDGTHISGSYIATVAVDPDVLSIDYFNWYSKLPYFYHQTYISSYGVHIEKMTFDWESFIGLGLRLPSLEEQNAISRVLQSADKEIELLNKKLDQLKEQKKGLMQILLTGKKRLKIK